jgi:hypothetical protein
VHPELCFPSGVIRPLQLVLMPCNLALVLYALLYSHVAETAGVARAAALEAGASGGGAGDSETPPIVWRTLVNVNSSWINCMCGVEKHVQYVNELTCQLGPADQTMAGHRTLGEVSALLWALLYSMHAGHSIWWRALIANRNPWHLMQDWIVYMPTNHARHATRGMSSTRQKASSRQVPALQHRSGTYHGDAC